MGVSLDGAVRTALKNHSAARGHESTNDLVKRIMSESTGSGGPISPGKKSAQTVATKARSRGAGEGAGNPGSKGVEEKSPDATGSTEQDQPADKGPGKRGSVGKPESHGISGKPSAQSAERATEPGKEPGENKNTSTAIGHSRVGAQFIAGEQSQNYADGSPRASADELFSKAGDAARDKIRKARGK
jgi:hypothetical protein